MVIFVIWWGSYSEERWIPFHSPFYFTIFHCPVGFLIISSQKLKHDRKYSQTTALVFSLPKGRLNIPCHEYCIPLCCVRQGFQDTKDRNWHCQLAHRDPDSFLSHTKRQRVAPCSVKRISCFLYIGWGTQINSPHPFRGLWRIFEEI